MLKRWFRRRRKRAGVKLLPVLVAVVTVGLVGQWVIDRTRDATAGDFLRLSGQLMRTAQSVDITVDVEGTVSELLVEEGSLVSQGQLVARIERRGHDRQIKETKRRAAALALELQCLRKGHRRDGGAKQTPVAATQLQIEAANQNCGLDQATTGAALTDAWARSENLEERLRLLERFWASARKFVQTPDGAGVADAMQLQKLLRIALARNLARADLAAARSDARSMHLTLKRERIERISVTADELEAALEHLAALQKLPRLIDVFASQTGEVRNVRAGLVGAAVSPASPLLRIVYGDDVLFLRAQVAKEVYAKVAVGDPSAVRVAALSANTPLFEGWISRRFRQMGENGHEFFVEVEVSPMHRERLEKKMRYGLDPGVSSIVEIQVGKANFSDLMRNLISNQGRICNEARKHMTVLCDEKQSAPDFLGLFRSEPVIDPFEQWTNHPPPIAVP